MRDLYDVSGCDGGVGRISRIYPVTGDVAGDGQEDGVPALGAEGGAGSVISVRLADLPEVFARYWGIREFVKEVANLVETQAFEYVSVYVGWWGEPVAVPYGFDPCFLAA